jgi:hypothetical protein
LRVARGKLCDVSLAVCSETGCRSRDVTEYRVHIFQEFLKVSGNVALYGCETWSLTLREDCRLRVFENKVLRRIFGPKRGVETTTRRGAL